MAALVSHLALSAADVDWLVKTPATVSTFKHECWPEYATQASGIPCGYALSNGLTARRFVTKPVFGTIDWILNATVEFGGARSMFRAPAPEATLRIDGTDVVVGGLRSNSTFRAYCNRSTFFDELTGPENASNAFAYRTHRVGLPSKPFPWSPGTRGSPTTLEWPPRGVAVEVDFIAPTLPQLVLTMHYEIYDGIPLIAKWLELTGGDATGDVVVEKVVVELFAASAPFGGYLTHGSSAPGASFDGASTAGSTAERPLLHAKTDQAHGASCEWRDDYPNSADDVPGCPQCKDQGAVEPLLNCTYTLGPGAHVNAKESFVSFRALLLATDSSDLRRYTLSRHRLTKLLAPHVTENPIFFHATDVSASGFRRAVDQMADVGFEMLIFSFGSGFRLETSDPTYLATIREQVAYAKSKGIEVGGYDLICLDRGHGGYGGNVGDEWCAVDPVSGDYRVDACFASGWYDKLFGLVEHFINQTGLAMLETDGPYGGGPCAATDHAHHHGLEDSVYRQTQLQSGARMHGRGRGRGRGRGQGDGPHTAFGVLPADAPSARNPTFPLLPPRVCVRAAFYHEMRARNVYVNQPDNFFFQGGSRTGMGYDENQYSLPRWRDLSISRAGLYDDLYRLLPTQGWMFLPLSAYHSGGDAATFAGHHAAYEYGLATYLGAGTAACYRGPVLYGDGAAGAAMRATLKRWVGFYKAHRLTLIEPVVHLRRPDMQSWDGWMHVRPDGATEVAVAMLFNPTDRWLNETIVLPLYYAGVDGTSVSVSVDESAFVTRAVGRGYDLRLEVALASRSVTTVVVRRAGDDR